MAGGHSGHVEAAAPQSTSASAPFFTLSVQLLATHSPPEQTRLPQSPPPMHFLPGAQPAHGPPQSTSVSLLFLILSVHDGSAHRPAVHTPLMQPLPTVQIFPSRHGPQSGPPQSTSVSVPFLVPSAQLAL